MEQQLWRNRILLSLSIFDGFQCLDNSESPLLLQSRPAAVRNVSKVAKPQLRLDVGMSQLSDSLPNVYVNIHVCTHVFTQYMCIYWDQPGHCNGHHKQKHNKSTREMLKFCTSHDHTPGRLEPESVHVMITFQGGAQPCQTKENITDDVWPSTEKLCFGICGKLTSGLVGPEGVSTKSLSSAYIGIQCQFATELV